MAHRPKPKYASKDPHEGPWTTCDLCGLIWSGKAMRFQYDFMGGTAPQRTGPLVCPKCEDALNYQQKLLILPPDPPPFRNVRPEQYAVDEAGPTQELAALVNIDDTDLPATFFLDLYDGDPDEGGASVLATLTGSATRTNYFTSMTTSGDTVSNTAEIEITDNAAGSAEVAWVVIFDAATAGNIIGSGALTPPQVVTLYNGAAFAVGALQGALQP